MLQLMTMGTCGTVVYVINSVSSLFYFLNVFLSKAISFVSASEKILQDDISLKKIDTSLELN